MTSPNAPSAVNTVMNVLAEGAVPATAVMVASRIFSCTIPGRVAVTLIGAGTGMVSAAINHATTKQILMTGLFDGAAAAISGGVLNGATTGGLLGIGGAVYGADLASQWSGDRLHAPSDPSRPIEIPVEAINPLP